MSWDASKVKPGDYVTVPAEGGGRVRVKVEQVNARGGRVLTVRVSGGDRPVAPAYRQHGSIPLVPVGQLRRG